MLKNYLNNLASVFPIVWDRFVGPDNGQYCIYGWIERTDGKRDFVVIFAMNDNDNWEIGMVTSSAKYSAKMSEYITNTKNNHLVCQKYEDLNV